METQGIKWSVNQAKIEDCGSFQTDEGEPMAWAKMGFFGGLASLKITPDDLQKVTPHKGKIVSITGRLRYEVKKGTGKETVAFLIDEIKPAAGK
jgi:hypothetical protein